MLFKNAIPYTLPEDFNLDPDQLETALASRRSRQCSAQELSTIGFTPAFGKGPDALVAHRVQDLILVCTETHSRLLPASVINQQVGIKVQEIEETENRKVYRKEKNAIKDELLVTLLPRAFEISAKSYLLIDLKTRTVFCNVSSPRRAEEMLSTIREALGSFPVRPLRTKNGPKGAMTAWLNQKSAPQDFELGEKIALIEPREDGGSARISNLSDEPLSALLSDGMDCDSLELNYKDQASFILTQEMYLKSIRYEDAFTEQAHEDAGDDQQAYFDASLILMASMLREIYSALCSEMGGVEAPTAI